MIDTNQIALAGQAIQAVHAQVQTNWPAIVFAAALIGRELRNVNAWLWQLAEFVIHHGGLVMLGKKLLWNPATKTPTANPNSTTI